MSEQEFNIIFSNNLNHYLLVSGHTQADIAKAIGVSTASVSNWCKGVKLPRMDKVDKLCTYFNITRSDLMREHNDNYSLSSHPRSLTPDQEQLLSDYDQLNAAGKEKVREYAADLTEQRKYTQDTASSSERAG